MRQVRSDEHPEHFRGQFRTDAIARALYSQGAGIARTMPSAVAVPADTDDLATLVRWARTTGHALIPRGSGSGMAAGAVGEHVIVDVSRMNEVGAIEAAALRIRAGAGALRNDIDRAARAVGLRFPVDPSSGAFCTIGGMVATNAAGARSLRHGATREWITALRCVFDDGSIAWIHRDQPVPLTVPAVRRILTALELIEATTTPDALQHEHVRKESSGYCVRRTGSPESPQGGETPSGAALIDLLVGSEGTLAIFTEVEVRLTPVAASTSTLLASFDSLDRATACSVAVAAAGASACELLDRTYLDVAERTSSTGIDRAVQAVLLIEVEEESVDALQDAFENCVHIAQANGAVQLTRATELADVERVWSLRHAASPTLSQLPATTRSMQFIEDGCVPPEHFATYVRGVRAALERSDTAGVIFGHAGDAHAHVNPLIDLTRGSWRNTVRRLYDDVISLTATLGGTLAGEHGDGRLRVPALDRVWSATARAAFHNLKDAADPSGILNPGCKVGAAGSDPFHDIRYDPALPPLPDTVAHALDRIERERNWQRFRLNFA